ncbi:ABC transporter permease [Photobacterium kishitanii]|uniref:ABC transporter permease n=1 Tax=Photobacterium kishitanii TaxID=318456 RepID=UPI000D16DCD3|nr:ABC transporter permease [Photobacterium kishitanii]PSV19657.1 sugar ABC transporter permease [Photobacterium kishitanii]
MNKIMYPIKNLFSLVMTNKNLIYTLTKRDITSRYKGSAIGVLWSFITPIMMLAVYTFVFSVVFKAKWNIGSTSKTEFALVLFSGLIIFNVFSECISRAPGLIVGNANYVKKVVFPVEILAIICLLTSLFNFIISFSVWLLFYIIFFGIPHIEILLLPIVLLPFFILILGLSWFLSSLGVYVRDIIQVIGIIIMIMMYLSPIFYPISLIPEAYQKFMYLSPLTYVVEQSRDVMMWGQGINWHAWFIYTGLSCVTAYLGCVWFNITKKGFADVI